MLFTIIIILQSRINVKKWTFKLSAICSRNNNSDACTVIVEIMSNVTNMSKVQFVLKSSCSNSQWESKSHDAPMIQLDTAVRRNT